ncbi:hypothetical protein JZ751_006409, partial [Albula glossodonta]
MQKRQEKAGRRSLLAPHSGPPVPAAARLLTRTKTAIKEEMFQIFNFLILPTPPVPPHSAHTPTHPPTHTS